MFRQTYSFREAVHALGGVAEPEKTILSAASSGVLASLVIGVPSWVHPVLLEPETGETGTAENSLAPTHLVLAREDCKRMYSAFCADGPGACITVQDFPLAIHSRFYLREEDPFEELRSLAPDQCGDYDMQKLAEQESKGARWLKQQRRFWEAWRLPDGAIEVCLDDLMVTSQVFPHLFNAELGRFDGLTIDQAVDVGGYFESEAFRLVRELSAETWREMTLPEAQRDEPKDRDEISKELDALRSALTANGFTERAAQDAVALMRPRRKRRA